jgi:hypothetical protein
MQVSLCTKIKLLHALGSASADFSSPQLRKGESKLCKALNFEAWRERKREREGEREWERKEAKDEFVMIFKVEGEAVEDMHLRRVRFRSGSGWACGSFNIRLLSAEHGTCRKSYDLPTFQSFLLPQCVYSNEQGESYTW